MNRDLILKLNEFVVNATGNVYGTNKFGSMSEIILNTFKTDAALNSFLSKADQYLIAWNPDGTIQDFKGNKIDTNVFEISPALNQTSPKFYAVREKTNEVMQGSIIKNVPVENSIFTTQTQTAGFELNQTTLLIVLGLLFLGLTKLGKA